jgi:hypothetical protein
MVWTEEMRKKALETRLAKKKQRGENHTIPAPSVLNTVSWDISIDVDWKELPMQEAQIAYAQLRKEFEKAGSILNSRSMPTPGTYKCFMCKQTHVGQPRGTDYSYINADTGLMEPVLICGEKCWLDYQGLRIKERREREMPQSA